MDIELIRKISSELNKVINKDRVYDKYDLSSIQKKLNDFYRDYRADNITPLIFEISKNEYLYKRLLYRYTSQSYGSYRANLSSLPLDKIIRFVESNIDYIDCNDEILKKYIDRYLENESKHKYYNFTKRIKNLPTIKCKFQIRLMRILYRRERKIKIITKAIIKQKSKELDLNVKSNCTTILDVAKEDDIKEVNNYIENEKLALIKNNTIKMNLSNIYHDTSNDLDVILLFNIYHELAHAVQEKSLLYKDIDALEIKKELIKNNKLICDNFNKNEYEKYFKFMEKEIDANITACNLLLKDISKGRYPNIEGKEDILKHIIKVNELYRCTKEFDLINYDIPDSINKMNNNSDDEKTLIKKKIETDKLIERKREESYLLDDGTKESFYNGYQDTKAANKLYGYLVFNILKNYDDDKIADLLSNLNLKERKELLEMLKEILLLEQKKLKNVNSLNDRKYFISKINNLNYIIEDVVATIKLDNEYIKKI